MGAKFYFFTDPAALAPQASGQAFGAVAPSGGKDRFRQTDIHAGAGGSTGPIPAFAICDGIVCAQSDDAGTLSLILKPIQQPPFDFPFISYVVYKGVDPASLLVNGVAAAGGTLDTSKAPANRLVDTVQKAWAANLNSGAPTRECLGLQLTQASNADYADGEAIDRLFYMGDANFQLPLVRGGWRIGDFSAVAFGMEVIVERIGYRPKIGLSRKRENVIAVDSLDPNTLYAPNDAVYFQHWHDKEECLNFVDPCALWGAFFAAKLRVWNGSDFDKRGGNAIYETVLRGTAAGAANFANRNRAYLDIRNEHGNSIDYYKADGPKIQLTLDAGADIDTCEVDYYASGWPSFAIDNANLPAAATGDRIDVRFALPKTANTRPLIYIAAGYRGALRPLKEGRRFIDCQRRGDAAYLYEAAITIPLADDSGVARISAGYHKLHDFKRPIVFNGQPVPPANANSLAPLRANMWDALVPLATFDDLPVSAGVAILRTFSDLIYVEQGMDDVGLVANPALAADATNAALILVPRARNASPGSSGSGAVKVSWPSLALPGAVESIFQYLAGLLPPTLQMTEVADPQALGTVELLFYGSSVGIAQPSAQNNPSTVVLALSGDDLSDLKAIVTANAPAYGTVALSLTAEGTHHDGVTEFVGFGISLDFLSGSPVVARAVHASQIKVYRHGDL